MPLIRVDNGERGAGLDKRLMCLKVVLTNVTATNLGGQKRWSDPKFFVHRPETQLRSNHEFGQFWNSTRWDRKFVKQLIRSSSDRLFRYLNGQADTIDGFIEN